jgi:hypothetical protein
MDACHLLLGIPLQYDRNVLHDRQYNRYTRSIKGKYIVLTLRREEVVVERKGKNPSLREKKNEKEKKKIESSNNVSKGII